MPAPLPDFLEDLGHGVYAIDTGFQRPRFDAAYLVVENGHAAFIDTGTNHAAPRLLAALDALGLSRDETITERADDIRTARRLGYVVKLLAIAELGEDGRIAARVHPSLVPVAHPLASVRDDVVIASKGVSPVGPGANDRGGSRYHIMREAERALRRLGLEEIGGNLVLDDSYFAIDEPEPGAFDGQPYRTYNVVPNALLMNFKALQLQFFADPEHGRVRIATDPVLANLANAYFERKQYELASETIQQALAIDPTAPEARRNLDMALQAQRQPSPTR